MDHADKEQPSHPQRGPAHAQGGLSWAFWLPISFLIYLLALGPAVTLTSAVPETSPAIQALYFWVDPLMQSSPTCDAAIQWYVTVVWRAP